MIYTEQTVKALKLCFVAHKEQTDKTGVPYVFHPFHLAEQMTDELTAAAALLTTWWRTPTIPLRILKKWALTLGSSRHLPC